MSFRPLSKQLHKTLGKDVRKEGGIYFTPKEIREQLYATLPADLTPKRILEPSFGSGEFLLDVKERWPQASVVGVEFNEKNFAAFKQENTSYTGTNYLEDFTKWEETALFDLIIGNPPFKVITEKNPEAMSGRPNLYVQFLWKCFTKHLTPGGILSFILPTSFLNASYYEPMRKILVEQGTLLAVKEATGNFDATMQDTFVLTVKKAPPEADSPWVFLMNGHLTFSPHAARLKELLKGSSTIKALGCSVKTGAVVWNQISHIEGIEQEGGSSVQKGNLVSSAEGAIKLYYSHNLGHGKAVDSGEQEKKKQYIKDFARDPTAGPAILVSRGYGNSYQFNFCRIDKGETFYAENHVNVITGPVLRIIKIAKSLADPRTAEFLKLFVGNGGLSKSELEEVLPIFSRE